MRRISLIFFVCILISCKGDRSTSIYGTWLVNKLSIDGSIIIPDPDTSKILIYLPNVHFFKSGEFTIPTKWKQNALGKFKIEKYKKGDSLIIYESSDTAMLGRYSIKIFDDEDMEFNNITSTYLELSNPDFYLFAQKTYDLYNE